MKFGFKNRSIGNQTIFTVTNVSVLLDYSAVSGKEALEPGLLGP